MSNTEKCRSFKDRGTFFVIWWPDGESGERCAEIPSKLEGRKPVGNE